MGLEKWSDQEIESELTRRKKDRHKKQQEAKKANEIIVVCPLCQGMGETTYFNMRVAAGEDDGKRTCELCQGKRRIAAQKSF